MVSNAILIGLLGTAALLAAYFAIVTAISGMDFALSQFSAFWYFILGLSLGFGIQIGLYNYLKNLIQRRSAPATVVAVSGTTTTLAMISCCAHYLANIIPLIGIAGIVSLIGQYQIEFFWIGLIFNAAGIAYIASKIIRFSKA